MQNQPEVGFQQLGLIPFTPKAGPAPTNSAPSSCGQDSRPPHSSPPHPCPWRGETPPRGGGWAVTHRQWDLGGPVYQTVGPGVKGWGGGGTENKPYATRVGITVRLVVLWWFLGAESEDEEGGWVMGVGGRHGAWNGEECVQEMQPEPKGIIPTTAAKLFRSQPKRNTGEGRKPSARRRWQRVGM